LNTLTKEQQEGEMELQFNVAFRTVYDRHIPPLIPKSAESAQAHLDALFMLPNHQMVVVVALRDLLEGWRRALR